MSNSSIGEYLAKRVLGWTYCKSSFEQYEPSAWYKGDKCVWGPIFNPAEDISAAMKLLEASEINVYRLFHSKEEPGKFVASLILKSGVSFTSVCSSLPRAICEVTMAAFVE